MNNISLMMTELVMWELKTLFMVNLALYPIIQCLSWRWTLADLHSIFVFSGTSVSLSTESEVSGLGCWCESYLQSKKWLIMSIPTRCEHGIKDKLSTKLFPENKLTDKTQE